MFQTILPHPVVLAWEHKKHEPKKHALSFSHTFTSTTQVEAFVPRIRPFFRQTKPFSKMPGRMAVFHFAALQGAVAYI